MADQFSEAKIDELKQAFIMFDNDTGSMSITDLPDLLKALGHNPDFADMILTMEEVRVII